MPSWDGILGWHPGMPSWNAILGWHPGLASWDAILRWHPGMVGAISGCHLGWHPGEGHQHQFGEVYLFPRLYHCTGYNELWLVTDIRFLAKIRYNVYL